MRINWITTWATTRRTLTRKPCWGKLQRWAGINFGKMLILMRVAASLTSIKCLSISHRRAGGTSTFYLSLGKSSPSRKASKLIRGGRKLLNFCSCRRFVGRGNEILITQISLPPPAFPRNYRCSRVFSVSRSTSNKRCDDGRVRIVFFRGDKIVEFRLQSGTPTTVLSPALGRLHVNNRSFISEHGQT